MAINKKQLLKFASVGVVNTAVDVAIFALLFNGLHFNLIAANTISTSVALSVGFFLNSRFTFKVADNGAKRFAAYLVVTLLGLWVLQPLVIMLLSPLIAAALGSLVDHKTAVLIAKLLSIGVSMTWNYLWYSLVIFRSTPKQQP